MNGMPIENQSILSDIDEETFATWIEDTLSPEEAELFVDSLGSADWLSVILDDYDDITESYESMIEEGYDLPDEFRESFPLPIPENPVYESYSSQDLDNQFFLSEEVDDSDTEKEIFEDESVSNESLFIDESDTTGNDYYNAETNTYVPENSDKVDNVICENSSEGDCSVDEYSEWDDTTDIQDNFDEAVL